MNKSMLSFTGIFSIISIALTKVSADEWGTYPSTWPFTTPDLDLPHTTPDFSYNPSSDPGGYHYNGLIIKDWMAEQTGPVFYMVPKMLALAYIYHSLTGLDERQSPAKMFNCTGNGNIITTNVFSGILDNHRYCTAPDCCKKWIGKGSYVQVTTAYYQQTETLITSILVAGGCNPATFTEELYCQSVNFFPYFCITYMTSRSQRQYLVSCMDYSYGYIITCPVVRAVGYAPAFTSWKTEPPSYISKLSILNSIVIYMIDYWKNVDRVCLPKSYFEPGQTPPSSSTSSTKPSSSTSGIEVFSILFAIFFLFIKF